MVTQEPTLADTDIEEAAQVLRDDIVGGIYAVQLSEYQRRGQMNTTLMLFIDARPDSVKADSLANLQVGGLLVNIDGRWTLTALGLAAVDRVLAEPDSIISPFL